jgi:hypothetical protein
MMILKTQLNKRTARVAATPVHSVGEATSALAIVLLSLPPKSVESTPSPEDLAF